MEFNLVFLFHKPRVIVILPNKCKIPDIYFNHFFFLPGPMVSFRQTDFIPYM